jgi:arylsulfatase A-like enzyme
VNDTTVACGIDLFPSLCRLAGAELPEGVRLDGEDVSAALLGSRMQRSEPIFWYYPNQPRPGKPEHVSPQLAVREGPWKLLAGLKGQNRQLYHLLEDPYERNNRVQQEPRIAADLWEKLRAWADSIGLER